MCVTTPTYLPLPPGWHVTAVATSPPLNNAHSFLLARRTGADTGTATAAEGAAADAGDGCVVFAAGSNYKFQLGIPATTTRHNNTHSCECFAPPVQLTTLPTPAVTVAAASLHSAAVGGDGRAWVWGCGSDGRLGLPGYEAKRARYLFHAATPTAVELGVGGRGGRVYAADAYKYATLAAVVEGE
jgi:hypothetical protein